MYEKNKDKFYDWLKQRKVTENYINDLSRVLENTLKLKFETPNDLKDILFKVKNKKYRVLALRNLFNFCEEYDFLDPDYVLKLKSKIKVTDRSNIDSFIPTEVHVEEFLKKVNEYDFNSYLFVKILLDSGLRISEVQHFIENIDKNKFEIIENVTVYPMYYLRGTKNSYYMFISKELYLQILDNILKLKTFNVEKLKTWIKRNNLLSLKYTRKYNFTKLIKAEISFEVANFIQGRVSQNIGFNHYLAKKEVALKEYRKVI